MTVIRYQVTLFTPVPIRADSVDEAVRRVIIASDSAPFSMEPVRPAVVVGLPYSCYNEDNTNYPILVLRITFFHEPIPDQDTNTCTVADHIAEVIEKEMFAMSNYKVVTDVTHEPDGCPSPPAAPNLHLRQCKRSKL